MTILDIGLGNSELAFALAAVFLAGLVRGFTGFALSALIMATLATVIPPRELIPVCTLLELASAIILLRGGFSEANKRIALGLQGGATLIGVPSGLYITNTLDTEISKLIALCLVVALALLQLLRIRLPVSPSTPATFGVGIMTGFVTGLASVGGMVIALYTLALQMPPKNMRGTLILIIFVGGCFTLLWQIAYGMVTSLALARAAIFAGPMLAGVLIGRRLFFSRYEDYYRPLSLALLIGLSLASLLRLTLA